MAGEDFLGGGYLAYVPEAEPCENRHDRCEDEACDACYQRDRRELREGVGFEEKTPKRGALEDRLDLSLQRGVVWLGLRCGGDFGVYPSVGHFRQVHCDEVVGVRFGFGTGSQWLTGVLA